MLMVVAEAYGTLFSPKFFPALRSFGGNEKCRQLPYVDTLLGVQEKLLTGTNTEGSIPTIHVSHHAIHANCSRTVHVGCDHLPQVFVSTLLPPNLSPAEKEALIASKVVEQWCRLSMQRRPIRLKRNRHST
jgi:hypothetical protein